MTDPGAAGVAGASPVDGAVGAAEGVGDTWAKVHDAYLETQLHRVRLLAQRRRLRRARPDIEDRPRTDAGSGQDSPPPDSAHTIAELNAAIERHDRMARELEAELRALGAPPGLTALRDAAGLSPLEVEVVTCALAYELDPQAGRLLSVTEDAARPMCAAVAAELFDLTATQAAALLDPVAALQRFRLLAPTDTHLPAVERPLRVEPRVLQYLRGSNLPDEALTGLVTALRPAPLVDAQREAAERLTAWLTDPDRPVGRSAVNLIGAAEQGRDAVAAAVAHALGMHAVRLDVERLVARPDRLDLIRLVGREALLLPAVVYLDLPDPSGEDPARAAAIAEVLDDLDGLVLIGSERRLATNRDLLPVMVPALDQTGRTALWRAALGPGAADGDIGLLAQQFAFGPAQVVRIVEETRLVAGVDATSPPTARQLWTTCRSFAGGDLGLLAQRIEPAARWDQLVLPDAELSVLREIVAQARHRTTVYLDWGMGARLPRGRGISALFTGPPGTGKTMSAEVMAAELDLDLYRVDLSSVVSKYIGETEKNLRRVFDAADRAGALLLFDEADALFGKRTEVKDSHDRHANVEINYLLQRMEDYAGLAILATNRKGDLDPAFLRRIRFLVSFPFPRPEQRRRLWATVLPPELPRAALDLDALARLEIAGGSIRNVAVNGAFLAAAAGETLSMTHLMRAAAQEYRKLDKLPSPGEFGAWYEKVRP